MNTNIAMQDISPQIDSPMNALAKVLQVKQAQQGQQMNALKMDEYSRGIESQNRLRSLLGGFGTDHSANQQKLLQGGFMKESQDYGKNQADLAKTAGETQYKQIETAHKKIDLMGQVFGFVKDNPSADSAMQATDYLVQNGIMTPEQAQATKAKIAADPSPETIRALATQAFQSALSTKDQLPKLDGFNAGNRYVQTSRNPITGASTETGSTAIGQSADSQASERSAAAGRAVTMRGQNMTDSRGRELNQITREVGLQKKELEVGKMQDEATARKQQKQAAVSSVKNQIGVIDKALNHKGRETATGLSGTIDPRNYIAGTNATDFKVVVDQIGGAAFLQAFEALKGGGQITEVEGKKATDAIARLNRAQSDGEFKTALTDLRKVMSDGLSRLSNGSEQVNSVDSLLDKYK